MAMLNVFFSQQREGHVWEKDTRDKTNANHAQHKSNENDEHTLQLFHSIRMMHLRICVRMQNKCLLCYSQYNDEAKQAKGQQLTSSYSYTLETQRKHQKPSVTRR